MQRRRTRQIAILLSIFVALIGISSAAVADEHVKGAVMGRTSDGSLMVRTDDADVAVMLNENTKIRETSGIRSIKVDVAALIPGLRVDVRGTFQSTTRFLADRITFKRNDLKIARDIQAGLTPTNDAVQSNRALIDSNQQENTQRFAGQQAALEQHEQRIAANDEKIVATSGRIANLDEYTMIDMLTVYFPNGKSTISSDAKTRLREMAEKAKGIEGYSVQVEGHASAVGRDALNQNLSRERAEAVTAVLEQNGVPSTKMFPPAAMGVSDQVASNATKEGQAQNRRVIVRLLQNRGITGN
jgi:outer membrane protein OmpA-like peptidoglycan-associated protein